MPSCTTCPSFVAATDDANSRLLLSGRTPNVSFCSRYGHVIGLPSMDNKALENAAQHIADSCESYGMQPLAQDSTKIAPHLATMVIMAPDVDVFIRKDGAAPDKVNSCAQCSNMVKSSAVNVQTSICVEVCKAKGALLLDKRQAATDCPFATIGTPTDDWTPVNIIPHLTKGFDPDFSFIKKTLSEHVDPRTVQSYRPLTQAEKDQGIRAFVQMKDPKGKMPPADLPIYDPSNFTDAERALIPTPEGDERVDLYVDYSNIRRHFAVCTWELDQTILLIGHSGVGKTEGARALAYMMQLPFHRIPITRNSTVEDMVGSPQYDPKRGTYFEYGRIPKAWTSPGIMVIDEVNLAPGEVRQFLRPLTDNSKQLAVDAAGGEILPRHHACYLMMTCNPAWDIRNSGTEDFAAADANRLVPMWVGLPPADIEREIITSWCEVDDYEITGRTLSQIMNIAVDIRQACDDGTFPDYWGVRQQIKVARLSKFYPLPMAYRMASLNFYEPSVVDMVNAMIESHIS
jgi:hypothetical protein